MLNKLPIGTVVENNNKLYMIVGLKENESYEVVEYPNGTTNGYNYNVLSKNDINKVKHVGYLDLDYVEEKKEVAVSSEKPTYRFDENGVIVFDSTAAQNNIDFENNNNYVEVKPQTVEVVKEEKKEDATPTLNYKFDEQGNVITEEAPKVEKPKKPIYKFDEHGVVIEVIE